ncbi:MAG: hypothetical protein ACQCN6_09215 [Candidatus Bathyarchaeia archaeon]|jgi:flavodoxin
MRKSVKIVLTVFAVALIAGFTCFSLVIFDVPGSLATGTHPLPNGAATGKAIVVYDPGLTGGAKDIATKIGYNLQDAGYDVLLAGVKSSSAADLSGYDVVVVGGPIYAGKPASTIQAYLDSFTPQADAKIGAFDYGSAKIDNANQIAVQQDVAPLPTSSTVTLNAVVKAVTSEDSTTQLQSFVNSLLS